MRLGTPISQILSDAGYQFDKHFPIFAGGPMMGLELPNLNAPVTKLVNCLLAPIILNMPNLKQNRLVFVVLAVLMPAQ